MVATTLFSQICCGQASNRCRARLTPAWGWGRGRGVGGGVRRVGGGGGDVRPLDLAVFESERGAHSKHIYP